MTLETSYAQFKLIAAAVVAGGGKLYAVGDDTVCCIQGTGAATVCFMACALTAEERADRATLTTVHVADARDVYAASVAGVAVAVSG
jgi:hypothetical protein